MWIKPKLYRDVEDQTGKNSLETIAICLPNKNVWTTLEECIEYFWRRIFIRKPL